PVTNVGLLSNGGARLLCRFEQLDNSALFLTGDVSAETHVMDDYVPLRIGIHCGWSNVVAAHAVVRPKLFASKSHVGIGWFRLICIGVGEHWPTPACKKEQEQNGNMHAGSSHFRFWS